MSTKTKIYIAVISFAVVIGGLFLLYISHQYTSIKNKNTVTSLPYIPAPSGWYNWGTSHYPTYETSTAPNSVTFGDHPIDSKDPFTALITVHMQTYPGKTDTQWIASVLSPALAQLHTSTSTRIWSVMDGKLVLEAITQTPAGGSELNYYVLNNGVVYSFSLGSNHSLGNIMTSSDAGILQVMVQDFTKSLGGDY